MKEKAFIAVMALFAALIAAAVIIPVRSIEVKLVTSPSGNEIYAKAREPFNITCQGIGDDSSKFSSMRWLNKEGNVIPEGTPGVQKVGQNSLKLILTDPTTEDSGVYKCASVYDKIDSLETPVMIIFYGDKPTFESYFENITAEEGSELEINCSAVGDKPLTYEWYKYEDKISEDKNSPMFVRNSESESTLIIRKVTESHSGMYSCLAKNEHGLTTKVFQLTVFPSSGNENDTSSILNIEVRNVTSNSVKFFLTIAGSIKSIEVKYTESRDTTEYRLEWNYGDNYEVKGLVPAGLYRFRFRTVPSKDEAWSKVYQVTLLPAAPEMIFRNLEGGNVKISWFVKTDDIMRGTIDQYELKYFSVQMEGGNRWKQSSCAVTIQIPTCKGSGYTISGLSQSFYYEIQLRSHTASGYGEPYTQKIYLSK